MNILFWLRKNYISKNGTAQIICTLSMEGKKIDIGTKLNIEPKNWKQAKQKAYGDDSLYINNALNLIRTEITEIKRKFEITGKPYTLKDIKEVFLGKAKQAPEPEPTETISTLQALQEIYEIRKRENTANSASREKSFVKVFSEFLQSQGLEHLPLKDLHTKHITAFLDNIKAKGNSNLTRNNYLTWLKAVLNTLKARGYIEANPAQNIKKLKEEQTKSIAIEPTHLRLILQKIKETDTETYIFCLFVFYTFIRPIELRRLTVGQINLQTQKIVIYGNQSKNKKTEYVMLPEPLKKVLQETKFLERNAEEPLFSDKTPLQYSRNKYSTLFAEICKSLAMPKGYSLYCLKHTGVVEYYKKGCGIKFIKEQCRHSSLEQTDKYLKSLGLFENEEILRNAPEI